MSAQVSFRSKVWKYEGKAGWYFVTLPKPLSKKIRNAHGLSEEAWGRLKASAQVGKIIWKTAIWYDTKAQSYLLPIKSEIRKKEAIAVGSLLNIKLLLASAPRARKNKLDISKPKMWS
ncbi:MAG: DUF1905 domain-containing protein [Bdellovibrionota bacterium]